MFALSCVRVTVNTAAVCVTVKKVGKVRNVTFQKVTAGLLIVPDTVSAFRARVIANQVGKAKRATRKTAKTRLAQTMEPVSKASVTAKLAGRGNIAT